MPSVRDAAEDKPLEIQSHSHVWQVLVLNFTEDDALLRCPLLELVGAIKLLGCFNCSDPFNTLKLEGKARRHTSGGHVQGLIPKVFEVSEQAVYRSENIIIDGLRVKDMSDRHNVVNVQ